MDYLAGLNVNSIVLRVPIQTLQGPNPNDHVIGVWATTSRQQLTLRTDDGSRRSFGAWTRRVGHLAPVASAVLVTAAGALMTVRAVGSAL